MKRKCFQRGCDFFNSEEPNNCDEYISAYNCRMSQTSCWKDLDTAIELLTELANNGDFFHSVIERSDPFSIDFERFKDKIDNFLAAMDNND